jgi:hypothetical protein
MFRTKQCIYGPASIPVYLLATDPDNELQNQLISLDDLRSLNNDANHFQNGDQVFICAWRNFKLCLLKWKRAASYGQLEIILFAQST